MLSEFIEKKMRNAEYKLLKNGVYFGEIPDFQGVWANADNLEDCRKELREINVKPILNVSKIKYPLNCNSQNLKGFEIGWQFLKYNL